MSKSRKKRMITCSRCKRPDVPNYGHEMCSGCNKDMRPGARQHARDLANARYHANADFLNAQQQTRLHTPDGAAVRKAARIKRYRLNSDVVIKKVLDWNKLHSKARNTRIRRHRLLKMGVPDIHTEAEWNVRLQEFNWACGYCLRSDLPLQREHMTPVSWGAVSSNGIENIIPACGQCNATKCDRNLLGFLLHLSTT